jgi:hypothetical protein
MNKLLNAIIYMYSPQLKLHKHIIGYIPLIPGNGNGYSRIPGNYKKLPGMESLAETNH